MEQQGKFLASPHKISLAMIVHAHDNGKQHNHQPSHVLMDVTMYDSYTHSLYQAFKIFLRILNMVMFTQLPSIFLPIGTYSEIDNIICIWSINF